jgi:hypothetical protein
MMPKRCDVVFRVKAENVLGFVSHELALWQVAVNEKHFTLRREFLELDFQGEPKSLGRVGPGYNERDAARTGIYLPSIPQNVEEQIDHVHIMFFSEDPTNLLPQRF